MSTTLRTRDQDHRDFPRCQVPTGYCRVRVKTGPGAAGKHLGHCYDLSASGMRFELDAPLAYGETVEFELSLTRPWHYTVKGRGQIVRYHDPDELGPVRMGMTFTTLEDPYARLLLDWYVYENLDRPTSQAA